MAALCWPGVEVEPRLWKAQTSAPSLALASMPSRSVRGGAAAMSSSDAAGVADDGTAAETAGAGAGAGAAAAASVDDEAAGDVVMDSIGFDARAQCRFGSRLLDSPTVRLAPASAAVLHASAIGGVFVQALRRVRPW